MKRFLLIMLSVASIMSLNAQDCNPNLLGSCPRGYYCQRLLGAPKDSNKGVCQLGSQEVMYESGEYPETSEELI